MAIKNVGEYTQAENLDGLKFPAFDEGEGKMFKVPSELFTNAQDKVIRTQAEFNNLIASPTWLGAQSVALVGEFTANAGIIIPATVKQIHGFNGAKITVTADGTVYGLSYAVRPEPDKGYEIRNLEVVCTGTDDGYGFYNCTNLTNCIGTGTADGGYGFGFAECSYCNGCKSGTTPSTTGIWGAPNTKIDADTCEAD